MVCIHWVSFPLILLSAHKSRSGRQAQVGAALFFIVKQNARELFFNIPLSPLVASGRALVTTEERQLQWWWWWWCKGASPSCCTSVGQLRCFPALELIYLDNMTVTSVLLSVCDLTPGLR
jgi:hypothetical protein